MEFSNVINIFLGVLLIVVVILLLQYMSAAYVFGLLFFIAILLYIIVYDKSLAFTGLVIFIIVFFVIQYIYYNQNIILTAKPMSHISEDTTISTASTASKTTVPDNLPKNTVWYLAFQSN